MIPVIPNLPPARLMKDPGLTFHEKYDREIFQKFFPFL